MGGTGGYLPQKRLITSLERQRRVSYNYRLDDKLDCLGKMREIGAFEAKSKLGTLLDWVERGEEVLITRRGKAVARLVPADAGFDRAKARRAVEGILEARRGVTLGSLKIKDLVNEGRP